jgi:hypothetical protein
MKSLLVYPLSLFGVLAVSGLVAFAAVSLIDGDRQRLDEVLGPRSHELLLDVKRKPASQLSDAERQLVEAYRVGHQQIHR